MTELPPENGDPDFPEYIEVTDVLDLHGLYPEQVEDIILTFLEHAREKGYEEVRIIHGKGKSRLKWEVRQILQSHPDVVMFGDAPPAAGHWGATVVRLKD